MSSKKCNGCNCEKLLCEFGKDKYRGDGLTTKCKSCRNIQNRQYFKLHPEMRKKHNDANKEKRHKLYNSPEWKSKLRDSHLKSKFDLTHIDYQNMLESQGGVCKICKRHRLASNKGHMVIDHCHETGVIRGVLCNWCNRALGLFEDNIELFQSAIKYLMESKK